MTPRIKRIQALAGIAFLLLITSVPVTAQNGFEGVHEYRGDQEGNSTGVFTGSINDGTVEMDQETAQIIREHTIHMETRNGFSGGNDEFFTIDPVPFQLGDIDSSLSKTRIEFFAYTSSNSQTSDTILLIQWDVLENTHNCGILTTGIEIPGGATAGAAGAGESRLVCTLDQYENASFTIRAFISNLADTKHPRIGVTVWQTEVVNITRPGNSGTITGNVSGTTSGTYDGNHSGFIEQINATADVNQTDFENITTNNLTFSNLFGSITVEELDFWIPVVFFTLAAWFFFSRDATWAGLASILGIIVSITNLPAWSIAASLLLIVLSITAEYLTKRVWKTNKQTM